MTVLGDGKARNAGAILSDALAAGLVRPNAKAEPIYDSLARYIQRAGMLSRRPVITMDEFRRFRLDQPADDWPDPQTLSARPAAPDAAALTARLRSTGAGVDPTAFEQAVCDAFAALGFVAQHLGGHEAPDGVLDAPLGSLAYRAMLECKTWQGPKIPRLDVAEAAKYRSAFHADLALLVAPALAEYDREFNSELKVHEVSAWSVDDLAQLLEIGADPHEIRPLVVPGIAADYLGDLLWERRHGRAKRVAVAAELLWNAAWEQQRSIIGAADVPIINEDGAMLLVDQALRACGSAASADRTVIRRAIAKLTSPESGAAIQTDAGGLTVLRPPAHASSPAAPDHAVRGRPPA